MSIDSIIMESMIKSNAIPKDLQNFNDEMNTQWDYGVLYKGKRIIEPQLDDFDWSLYRTIPLSILKREKIGVCWDFVNYQHDAFKKMGYEDQSYLFITPKSEKPDDVVTHTFSIVKVDGQWYWFESSWYKYRGVKPIRSYKDVLKFLRNHYGKDNIFELYRYNPAGLDKSLTDQEFFDKVTQSSNAVFESFNPGLGADEFQDVKEVIKSLDKKDYKGFLFNNVKFKSIAYDNGKPVAFCCAHEYKIEDGYLGVVLSVATNPKYRRRGYCTKCVKDVIKQAKADPRINEIAWSADTTNYQSIAMAKSVGFKDWYVYKDTTVLKL